MQRRIQLKDIAQRANVSIAMVSYVLNGKLSHRINEKTAQKIKSIAEELNYKPNRLARSLKTNKTQSIGLILPDLTNNYFSQLARILENELKNHGYTAFISNVDEDNIKFRDMINSFSERNVDGLIVLPVEDSYDEVCQIHQSGMPYVLIDRYYANSEFNYVVNDNHFGVYQLVKRLKNNGKNKLAFITTDYEMLHIQERKNGFIKACTDFKITDSFIREIPLNDLKKNVHKVLDELMESHSAIDGLIFGTDILALHGLGYAVEKQLKVPDEIEIAAHDEAIYYSIFSNKLVYYQQPLDKIGRNAVDFLMSRINGSQTSIQQMLKGEILET